MNTSLKSSAEFKIQNLAWKSCSIAKHDVLDTGDPRKVWCCIVVYGLRNLCRSIPPQKNWNWSSNPNWGLGIFLCRTLVKFLTWGNSFLPFVLSWVPPQPSDNLPPSSLIISLSVAPHVTLRLFLVVSAEHLQHSASPLLLMKQAVIVAASAERRISEHLTLWGV